MIELVSPDLTWMEAIHDCADFDSPATIQPGKGLFTSSDGKHREIIIEQPHVLAVAPGLRLLHRGTYGAVEVMPPGYILQMAVAEFFGHSHLAVLEKTTLDGLVRWCKEAPSISLKRCTVCDGRMVDPSGETHPDDASLHLACQKCDGVGLLVANWDESLGAVGRVKVDRWQLMRVLKHLRGDEVIIGAAPSVTGGLADIHIRHIVRQNSKEEFGDWRIVMQPVADVDKLVTPAVR